MALAMNDDFANRELSIEELEAIAAGNWLGDAARWVGHEAVKVWHAIESPSGAAVIGLVSLAMGGAQLYGVQLKQN